MAGALEEVKRAASIAKLYSTEAAVAATRIATQIFGGNGFMEEYPVARFYRDAKILEIGEGHLGDPADGPRAPARPAERLTSRPRPYLPFASRGRIVGMTTNASDPRVTSIRTRIESAHAASDRPTPEQRPSWPPRASSTCGTGSPCSSTGLLRRGRPVRQRPGRGLPADGVVTGRAPSTGARSSSSPTTRPSKAGSWGADGREDRPGHRDGAARGDRGVLAGRLGRRPDHRPGGDVPRTPRRRPDLPQPGRPVGEGASGLLPLRALRRRRRISPASAS